MDDPLAPFRREPHPVSTDEQTRETLTEHEALELAIVALNQIPNQPIRMEHITKLKGEYKDTDDLLPVLGTAWERGRKELAREKEIQAGEEDATLAEVKPQVIRLLETFEDFIRAAEQDHGENYWAIRTDIEQVFSKIYPERERAAEEAERRYLEQDIEHER